MTISRSPSGSGTTELWCFGTRCIWCISQGEGRWSHGATEKKTPLVGLGFYRGLFHKSLKGAPGVNNQDSIYRGNIGNTPGSTNSSLAGMAGPGMSRRSISYWKWWVFQPGMLAYQRVTIKKGSLIKQPGFNGKVRILRAWTPTQLYHWSWDYGLSWPMAVTAYHRSMGLVC